MRSLIDFVKYNNAVPIALAVLVLGTGAAFAASPELRQSVFSSEKTVSSVPTPSVPPKPADTSRLLALNLETYDISIRIDSITERSDAYEVDYSYNTYDIVSGVWQETRKHKHITAVKAMFGKRSLSEYLSEQLGQVTHQELAYLGEVQAAAAKQGAGSTAAKYAGLVGKELKTGDGTPSYAGDGKSKTGEGSRKGSSGDTSGGGKSSAVPGISDKELREMVVKAVSDFLAVDTSMPATGTETTTPTEGATEPVVSDSTDTAENTEEPAAADTETDTQAEEPAEDAGSIDQEP